MSIAVLVAAKKGAEFDGVVYGGFSGRSALTHSRLHVVRVDGMKLAKDVRKTVSIEGWRRICAVLQAREAINRKDAYAAANCLWTSWRIVARPSIAMLQELTANQMTDRLKDSRLVVWDNMRAEHRDILELGVFCANLKAALFARAALGDLRSCPCCEDPFVPHRPDQDYCSIRCRETFRKRRLRARQRRRK